MKNRFHNIAKVSLLLVYLVILAGAVVRMTGSGMGCPDWPKCFGYYIPPTDSSQLQWQPDKAYKKGQVIIKNESLWVATQDFVSNDSYKDQNWKSYDKHDYAVFNASHTWTEFINRLMGALAGLGTLLMALVSLKHWKKNKAIPVLSWLVVFAMGFQAWLGATVVFSVLEPVKITLHMIMALVIVAMILFLIYKTGENSETRKNDTTSLRLIWIVLGVTVLQIILGTQVRQFVDEQATLLGDGAKAQWLADPTLQFYLHRSFSILVVAVNLLLAYRIYKYNLDLRKIHWVLVLLLIEIISGVAMNYLDFPFGSQPVHLFIASLLFGVQFYLLLEIRGNYKRKSL